MQTYKIVLTYASRQDQVLGYDVDDHHAAGENLQEAVAGVAARFMAAVRAGKHPGFTAAEANDLYIDSAGKIGEKQRFAILGLYSDHPEGGSWMDHVEAVDDEDARFQAAWIMASNESVTTYDSDLESVFRTMDAIQIEECHIENVTLAEALALLKKVEPALAKKHQTLRHEIAEMLVRAGVN